MPHRLRFPHETSQQDIRITLRDGVALFARLWRPITDEAVPVLLEYSPERLTDTTVPRDAERHPWYAGHGYASVRVDARGHGNSGGLPDPAGLPGSPATLADTVEVIDWLATRPWCTGRVGMLGIGWGGACALATAALAPEPLAAVVAVCCGDDPYDDSGCYRGGAVLAESLHSTAAARLAAGCLPPDPAHTGDGWRDQWLDRLAAIEPPAHHWLAHQLRDDFWTGTPQSDARAAVLLAGGLHDPARDAVPRLLTTLPPDRVRALLGPWTHQYPDRGLPGPAIGFLQETRRWWDRHLRDIPNEVMDEPPLRVRHDAPDTPGGPPGRWTAVPGWPPPGITPVVYELRGAPVLVDSPQSTGSEAGPYRTADGTTGGDQRADDARSACFEFAVTDTPLEILGTPRVTLRLCLGVPHGLAVARLCDIAPDGTSTPVTWGVLSLAARHGTDRAHAWPPGTTESVTFPLAVTAHTVRPGHRLRLAVSSAYWPWVWPEPDQAGHRLEPEGSWLELPLREAEDTPVALRSPGGEPEHSPTPLIGSAGTLDGEPPTRVLTRDLDSGVWRQETRPGPGGTRVHPDGLEITEEARETRTVQERDPGSARLETTWRIRLHRPALPWDTTVETRSVLSRDGGDFVLWDEAVCRAGAEIVFHRTWEKRIPRLAG
ncbi:CocE/NonD family hydrolase [Streptomyces sp. NPDC000594]|uniref:CocE/NonD family hydrolase n=1 Tax=Streptomyces sp. NPDC000594 TaxID=3154261 RepID=UPI0033324601